MPLRHKLIQCVAAATAPSSTQDETLKTLGLVWAHVEPSEIAAQAARLP